MQDPIGILPEELIIECFRALHAQGPGRVAVSRVSRGWRRVALADPQLWNTLVFQNQPNAMLLTFLSRSLPLPFELSWRPLLTEQVNATSGISEAFGVIVQSLDRFGSLELTTMAYGFMSLLQQRDAPLLTTLKWHQLRCPCASTVTLATQPETATFWPLTPEVAARIRELELSHFMIPHDTQPLRSLRSFSAHNLPPGFSFAAFPCLETLRLSEVTGKCMPLLLHLPRSLASVTLQTIGGFYSADFGPFYRAGLKRRFPKLTALSVGYLYSGLADGIRLFLETSSGPYRLEFLSGLRLESPADKITHEIRPTVRGAMWEIHSDADKIFRILLTRLSSLALSVPLLCSAAIAQEHWECSLPLLRDLRLHMQSAAQRRYFHRDEVMVKLLTPQLESVSFYMPPQTDDCAHDAADSTRWGAEELPRALQLLFPNAPFAKMTLWVGGTKQLLAQNLSLFAGITHKLCIGDVDTGAEVDVTLEC